MLTRTQFLAMSGFSDARFQSLTRRHLDNLQEDWSESPSEDVERWRTARRKYAWVDVLLLRALHALTRDGGLSTECAFSCAANLTLMAPPEKLADRSIEYWGAAAFYLPRGEGHFVGTLKNLADDLRPGPPGWEEAPVDRVVMVNLSTLARQIEAKASASGFAASWAR